MRNSPSGRTGGTFLISGKGGRPFDVTRTLPFFLSARICFFPFLAPWGETLGKDSLARGGTEPTSGSETKKARSKKQQIFIGSFLVHIQLWENKKVSAIQGG
jgi:hypothetical protein